MFIDHKEYLDVRDLSDLMIEGADAIAENDFANLQEKSETVEMLRELYKLTVALRQGSTRTDSVEFNLSSETFVEDMKTVAQELSDFQNNHSPTLIAGYYFTEATQEYVEDVYNLDLSKMPDLLVIDWTETAAKYKQGHFEVKLEDESYFAQN